MRKLYKTFGALLILLAEVPANGQLIIKAIESQYATDAPPQLSANLIPISGSTGIGYEIKYQDGTTPSVAGCSVTWYSQHGMFFPHTTFTQFPDGEQDQLANNSTQAYIRWVNKSTSCPQGESCKAIGKLKATFSGNGCALKDVSVENNNVKIRLLLNPGTPSVTGHSGNPSNISCGSQTITLTASAALNATSYSWQNIPTAWTGSRTTTSPSATFVVDAGSDATSVRVLASRGDVPGLTTTGGTLNIVRPTVTLNSVTPNTDVRVCNTSSIQSYSASGTGDKFQWTPTSTIKVNGSSTAQVIAGPVNVTATGDGSFTIKAYSSACAKASSNSEVRYVKFGPPSISGAGQYLFEPTTNLWKCYINPISLSTPTWSLVSGDASFSSTSIFDPYISSVNGGTVQVVLSTICGNSSPQYFTIPPAGSFLMAFPNPATDQIVLRFKNSSSKAFVPESVELFNQEAKAVRSIKIDDNYFEQHVHGREEIIIGTRDLPRGTYFLHITPPEGSANKEVEKIRFKLE